LTSKKPLGHNQKAATATKKKVFVASLLFLAKARKTLLEKQGCDKGKKLLC
jgi:hypothetical protein